VEEVYQARKNGRWENRGPALTALTSFDLASIFHVYEME
jgi:hypothetical protein